MAKVEKDILLGITVYSDPEQRIDMTTISQPKWGWSLSPMNMLEVQKMLREFIAMIGVKGSLEDVMKGGLQ